MKHDTDTLLANEARWKATTLVLCAACTIAACYLLAISTGSMRLGIWLAFALPCIALIASNTYCLISNGITLGMIPVALISLAPASIVAARTASPQGPARWVYMAIAVATLVLTAVLIWWFQRIVNACDYDASVSDNAVIIVLGGLIRNGRPVRTVANRLQVAAQLWRESPLRVIVTTGGPTPDQSSTEAAAMSHWLQVQEGVPASSILVEDQAINTEQNIKQSLELIRERGLDDCQLCIVSSDYHLYRARAYARKLGADVTCIPSQTPKSSRLQQWCREVLTILVKGVK